MEKQELLIVDDFGIQSLEKLNRAIPKKIVEDRHGKRTTVIPSQMPVNRWHKVIREQTIADAILDRIANDSRDWNQGRIHA